MTLTEPLSPRHLNILSAPYLDSGRSDTTVNTRFLLVPYVIRLGLHGLMTHLQRRFTDNQLPFKGEEGVRSVEC